VIAYTVKSAMLSNLPSSRLSESSIEIRSSSVRNRGVVANNANVVADSVSGSYVMSAKSFVTADLDIVANDGSVKA
jgi:hypothetical protein